MMWVVRLDEDGHGWTKMGTNPDGVWLFADWRELGNDRGMGNTVGEVYMCTLVMDVLHRLIPVQYYVMHALVPPDTTPCTPIF